VKTSADKRLSGDYKPMQDNLFLLFAQ